MTPKSHLIIPLLKMKNYEDDMWFIYDCDMHAIVGFAKTESDAYILVKDLKHYLLIVQVTPNQLYSQGISESQIREDLIYSELVRNHGPGDYLYEIHAQMGMNHDEIMDHINGTDDLGRTMGELNIISQKAREISGDTS